VTDSLVAEPIGPGGPLFGSCEPPLSLARPFFLGDVNFFFLYIAVMIGENLQ